MSWDKLVASNNLLRVKGLLTFSRARVSVNRLIVRGPKLLFQSAKFNPHCVKNRRSEPIDICYDRILTIFQQWWVRSTEAITSRVPTILSRNKFWANFIDKHLRLVREYCLWNERKEKKHNLCTICIKWIFLYSTFFVEFINSFININALANKHNAYK
jgi:hypothetical protein